MSTHSPRSTPIKRLTNSRQPHWLSRQRGRFALLSIVLLLAVVQTISAQPPIQSTGEPALPTDVESAAVESDGEQEGASQTKIVATKSLLQVVRNGGPLMIPIGLCSFLLTAFIFERSISLRRGRIIPRPFVKRLLEQLKAKELSRDEAVALCQKNRSPVSEVFEAALQKWDKPSVEVEQAIIDSGERAANGLRRYLRLINGIATVCPLLGLLGTVLGMIHAFDAIAITDAQARPEVTIATGISQALLTTAAGLSVAIPALIAHLYFVGRVDRLIVEIDAIGQKVVNLIASDGWQPQPVAAAAANNTEKKKRSRAA